MISAKRHLTASTLWILVSFMHFAYAQDKNSLDSAQKEKTRTEFGFARVNSALAVAPTVNHNDFNAGNIHDPYQLIQGKVSGVLIAKPGNDPNEPFAVRIRGMNSVYFSNSPLIVVDGVPYSSLLAVDPFDIASITVVKDAATAAKFGLNSQSGVLLVKTHTGSSHGLNIRHYSAFESPDTESGMLNSAEYVAAGGSDLGSAINWKDEITRNALTHVTHISYGEEKGPTEYYAALNYRNADGVLEESGFNQISGRAKISHRLFDGRLKLSGNGSIASRSNSFSFPEAFKYAKTFNPTSEVVYPNGQFRDYLLFDNFNPAGMIRQNINDGKTNIYRLGANATFDVSDDVKVAAGYGWESQENQNRRYWAQSSYWFGQFAQGYRQEMIQKLNSNFGFTSIDFSKPIGNSIFEATGSFSFQNLDFNESLFTAYGFESDEEGRAKINDVNAFNHGVYRSLDNLNKNQGITSYRAAMSWSKKKQFFLDVNLTKESYSDHIKGTTFGAILGFDFAAGGDYLFSELKPRVSWGRSAGALAFTQNYNPRSIIFSWSSLSNHRVSPERRAEFGAGIDWASRNLRGSVNFFTANSSDILTETYDYDPDSQLYSFSMVNADGMSNSGIEIDIVWKILESQKMSFETSLNFSTISNKYESNVQHRDFQPLEFVVGHGSTDFYALRDGKAVGQFRGFEVEGIVDNEWIFKDIDGSGGLSLGDMTAYGEPLPSSFFGWSSSVRLGRWHGSLLLRGAFGHFLFNTTRFGFENTFLVQQYNATISALDPPISTLQDTNYPSNFYLEKASYLTLDNVGISFDLFKPGERKFSCTLNLAAQNVFLISDYSGRSPEVRLDYFGISYAAGQDSQYTYANSRTILMGIHFKM